MEFLLLWWDELDDLTHACRHLVGSAFSEVAEASVPLAGAATGMIVSVALCAQTWIV